jgi:large subunit ribosomal protein L23
MLKLSGSELEIKKAVEKQYGVNVEKVNTLNVMGKQKTRLRGFFGL